MSPGQAERLIGRWMGRVNGEPVAMEFAPDGRMAYVVLEGENAQTTMLAYSVEGDMLVTHEPSGHREERTQFKFERGGGLVMWFGDSESYFTKAA